MQNSGRRILNRAVVLCFLALPGQAALLAQETVLQLHPAQTRIEFTLPAFLHTVHGTFNVKGGTVRFDQSGKATGRIVVDAASSQTGNGTRDRKMHRVVLESGRYPEIIFVPDHVEGAIPAQGTFKINLHGRFWLHGQQHEMTLPVQGARAGNSITATTNFVIPYVEWGLKDPSTIVLRVSKEVQVNVQSAATVAPDSGVPSQ